MGPRQVSRAELEDMAIELLDVLVELRELKLTPEEAAEELGEMFDLVCGEDPELQELVAATLMEGVVDFDYQPLLGECPAKENRTALFRGWGLGDVPKEPEGSEETGAHEADPPAGPRVSNDNKKIEQKPSGPDVQGPGGRFPQGKAEGQTETEEARAPPGLAAQGPGTPTRRKRRRKQRVEKAKEEKAIGCDGTEVMYMRNKDNAGEVGLWLPNSMRVDGATKLSTQTRGCGGVAAPPGAADPEEREEKDEGSKPVAMDRGQAQQADGGLRTGRQGPLSKLASAWRAVRQRLGNKGVADIHEGLRKWCAGRRTAQDLDKEQEQQLHTGLPWKGGYLKRSTDEDTAEQKSASLMCHHKLPPTSEGAWTLDRSSRRSRRQPGGEGAGQESAPRRAS